MHHFWQPQVNCCSLSGRAWQRHDGSLLRPASGRLPLPVQDHCCSTNYRAGYRPEPPQQLCQHMQLAAVQPQHVAMSHVKPTVACLPFSFCCAALCPHSCSSRLQMVTTHPLDLQGGQLSLQEGFPHFGGHQLPDHPGRRPCAHPASRVQVSVFDLAVSRHNASESHSFPWCKNVWTFAFQDISWLIFA